MATKFYVSTSVRCVDEIDIRDTKSCIIRAILLPESPSAFRSCQLIKEEPVPIQVPMKKSSLPSPDNSSEEEDSSPDEAENGREEAESDRGAERRRARTSQSIAKRPVILLIQSPGLQRFTLGSSPENDIVLKIDEAAEGCYINLWHCRIYPDPDSDAALLSNLSSSVFSIQHLKSGAKISIAPSHDVSIEHGTWRLTLGKGLCFQIRVLPRPSPEEDGCTWSLLSSCEGPLKTHSYPANTRARKQRISLPAATEFDERASEKAAGFNHAQSGATSRDRSSSPTKRTASQIHRSAAPATTQGDNLGSQKWAISSRDIEATTTILATTLLTKVFKVSRPDGTVFAAKVCRHHDLKSAADTWKREATILQKLDHRHIVKLFELDTLQLTLRLEYISGLSVNQFVNDDLTSAVPESKHFSIWSNISDAISYIHRKGILHNDIKPANVILGPDSRGAVLCDFGLAVSSTEPSNGGTPNYVAPECLRGWDERSFPSDIWAFGVTMLFVTGHISLPQGDWRIADITKRTLARQEFMSWLASLQTVIGKIPERLQLMREMLVFERGHRIKAEALSKQVRKLAQQQAERYSQRDRLLLAA